MSEEKSTNFCELFDKVQAVIINENEKIKNENKLKLK